MKKILSLFKRPWVISLLGLLILVALIWFAGPWVGFANRTPLDSEISRLLTILVLLLIWGLNNLRKQMQATRANNEIVKGLAETKSVVKSVGSNGEASGEEVALLKERFEEAMDILEKSRGNAGRHSLYNLPWYIIIGPPGSGKTTALVNSGLEFPLAERFGKTALHGIGGTRNCDWWFTNEAVLLDTAGRYVTQDSDATQDRVAWEGFLDLIKKYRRRRPVNGVLVAISLADLMVQTEQERDAHVQAIKQRTQELSRHFGIRFPVYVLLTKADLVAGFMEFFDDLGREERSQAWGMTFHLAEDNVQGSEIQRFMKEYDSLVQRLYDRLLWRLHQERDLKRRALLYSFPQQMAALKEALDSFLTKIFQPSRYEEPLLLRGVYFTSGTQEGAPIDRLRGSLARTFGLDPQAALPSYGTNGRSYFITGLLKDVVFREAELAGVNQRLETRRVWLQRGAYSGALVTTLAGLLALNTSYFANRSYVQDVGKHIDSYRERWKESPPKTEGFGEILPRLDELRVITDGTLRHADGVPWYMQFALYQGDALNEQAQDAYGREMNAVFLPRIKERLKQHLRSSNADLNLQYDVLKAYLMMGEPERLDPRLFTDLMGEDWKNAYPTEAETQESLRTHLAHLLRGGMEPVRLDKTLVQDVRIRLKQMPLASLVYDRLRSEYQTDNRRFRLGDAVGAEGSKVFTVAGEQSLQEEVSELFTSQGFHDVFLEKNEALVEQIRQERWVLGEEGDKLTNAELDELEETLRKLYAIDYIRSWHDMLSTVSIVSFKSPEHGMQVLNVLAGPNSPMRRLLEVVERNTVLTRSAGVTQQLGAHAVSKTAQANRFAGRLPSGSVSELTVRPEPPEARVADQFESLNRLVRRDANGVSPFDSLITLFSELSAHLDTLGDGLEGVNALRAATGKGGSSNSIRRVRMEAKRQPEPVRSWLEQLANNTQSITLAAARSQLNTLWTATVLPNYKKMLANRYPIDKASQQEVTLKDFGRFFGHGGVMDAFFETHLRPFVDSSRSKWRWRTVDNISLGISHEVLRQFQRARLIRDAFFADGGQNPLVSFGVKPVFLSRQLTNSLLDIDRQQLVYRHGPTRVNTVQWPGPAGAGQVRVRFGGRFGTQPVLSEEGQWAWFRALDQNRLEVVSSDRLVVSFEKDSAMAKYEIQASSVLNPFHMQALHQFRCPKKL